MTSSHGLVLNDGDRQWCKKMSRTRKKTDFFSECGALKSAGNHVRPNALNIHKSGPNNNNNNKNSIWLIQRCEWNGFGNQLRKLISCDASLSSTVVLWRSGITHAVLSVGEARTVTFPLRSWSLILLRLPLSPFVLGEGRGEWMLAMHALPTAK